MAEKQKVNIVERVAEIAEKLAAELELELWDVQFLKEGASWFLRIFIDKSPAVSIEDCEKMSRSIDKILDKEDFIKQSYYLEVSSPGIERELKNEKHFLKYVGQKIKLHLFKALNGAKEIEGELLGFEDDVIKIKAMDTEMEIKKESCSKIRLIAEI
jgi:ribosome maturation factor RimP